MKDFKVGGKARITNGNLRYPKRLDDVVNVVDVNRGSSIVQVTPIPGLHDGWIYHEYLEPIERKRNLKDFYEKY